MRYGCRDDVRTQHAAGAARSQVTNVKGVACSVRNPLATIFPNNVRSRVGTERYSVSYCKCSTSTECLKSLHTLVALRGSVRCIGPY